jgi:hypothetical protein
MMNFDCEVKVVDMMMGSGKTSAAINYMNAASPDEKFLYITPYLDEVERIKESCSKKHFVDPRVIGTKLKGMKYLLEKGNNIVSTHALFRNFDMEIVSLCRRKNYTLILDEVADVVDVYPISSIDFHSINGEYINVSEETGMISWNPEQKKYKGVFDDIKHLCQIGGLAYYGDARLMQLFPIKIFNAFKKVIVMTYMFNAQLQRCYFDYFKMPYSYIYIRKDGNGNYTFTDNPDKAIPFNYDFKKLIHIFEDQKLNMTKRNGECALSKSWYEKNSETENMERLRKNICNFFINKRGTKSSQNLWTTFKDFKQQLSGKGYGRAFVPLNMRASNKYRDRVSVAYPVNRYLNTGIKNFFLQHGVKVDEDGFALSEMLQFIWRSAIRDGKEIWIYVPSARMRNLLKNWIAENSAGTPAENAEEIIE